MWHQPISSGRHITYRVSNKLNMSRRRHGRGKLPTEPVSFEIESLSHEGRGIAHLDGKVAFVDGALAREQVSESRPVLGTALRERILGRSLDF